MKRLNFSQLLVCLVTILRLVTTSNCPDCLDDEEQESQFLVEEENEVAEATDTDPILPSTRLDDQPMENQRPIIGVLAHKYTDRLASGQPSPHQGQLYISASSIQLVEGGGARAVPIFADGDEKYLRQTFKSVNGIFFPGGMVGIRTSDYARAGKFLYNLAMEANDEGTYFPLWGECLGLQFMMDHAAGGRHRVRSKCGQWNSMHEANFTKKSHRSRLYGKMPAAMISIMETKNVCSHNHRKCVGLDSFEKFGLDKIYKPLTLNYDDKTKLTYVSSMEAINYPFYALAFHPEANLYVWAPSSHIDHSSEAMYVAQYFAKFFVDEARKNDHHFETEEQERDSLIYNFNIETVQSRVNASETSRVYFFPGR